MALRIARQRPILLAAHANDYGFLQVRSRGHHAVPPWYNIQWSTCARCRRRLYTQVVQGKSIPFFQRSFISTTDPLNLSPSPPRPQQAPAIDLPLQSQTLDRPRRRASAKAKSPTIWAYFELSKPRLSFLIVLSTMSAYAIAPYPASIPTLLFLSTGTYLCSAGANTFNMLAEPEFDALMSRTRNRPLVRKAVTPTQAKVVGITTSILGIGILSAINPVVAALGAGNIVLYAAVYTPLKRKTILNTWIGSVVGGIPPLMGWAACSPFGDILSHPGGLLLAGLLFSWQFHHFNALSYTARHDYARAGYKMMSVTNPALNARVALRYSLACIPLCWGLVASGLADPFFLIDSSVVNVWVAWRAYRFWREGGEKGSARALFFAGLIQLPAVLVLAMLHKVGLWDWLWEREDEVVEGDVEIQSVAEVV